MNEIHPLQLFITQLVASDKTASNDPHPEYSAAFAEQIIAASCEPFIEIDIDALLAEMLAEALKAQAADPGAPPQDPKDSSLE